MVLRAIANIMIGRSDAAMKDLSNPFVGNQHDAPLWRALASARLGKWAEARDGFRNAEAAMTTLPLEFQRMILQDMVRASIEVGDFTGAASRLNEFEVVGIPRELEPTISVLTGRAGRSARPASRTRCAPIARPTELLGSSGGGAGPAARDSLLQYGRGELDRRADASPSSRP